MEKNPGRSAFAWHGENHEYEFPYDFINYIGNVEIDAIISVIEFTLKMKFK